MAGQTIHTEPLDPASFAPFGEVVEAVGDPDMVINRGLCGRHHDLTTLDFADGRAGVSIFRSETRSLPYVLDLVERHPLGSQTFLPMYLEPFLAIVCPDEGGRPGRPRAFVTRPGQGLTYRRNTWHGVLTPLSAPGLFAVIDRIGEGDNLEEHVFSDPYVVDAGPNPGRC